MLQKIEITQQNLSGMLEGLPRRLGAMHAVRALHLVARSFPGATHASVHRTSTTNCNMK